MIQNNETNKNMNEFRNKQNRIWARVFSDIGSSGPATHCNHWWSLILFGISKTKPVPRICDHCLCTFFALMINVIHMIFNSYFLLFYYLIFLSLKWWLVFMGEVTAHYYEQMEPVNKQYRSAHVTRDHHHHREQEKLERKREQNKW